MTATVMWISIGVIAFALIVLVVVSLGTSGRIPALQAAMTDLKRRQQDVAPLQEAVEGMQAELAHVQERVALTQERVQAIKAARASD